MQSWDLKICLCGMDGEDHLKYLVVNQNKVQTLEVNGESLLSPPFNQIFGDYISTAKDGIFTYTTKLITAGVSVFYFKTKNFNPATCETMDEAYEKFLCELHWIGGDSVSVTKKMFRTWLFSEYACLQLT